MPVDLQALALAKRFEPIMLFHPSETFFPIDPKFYLERCALWRSEPHVRNYPGGAAQEKQDWGEPPATSFPRKPQLNQGEIAALKAEATSGKKWIGDMVGGASPYFVIPELVAEDGKVKFDEDRFLQFTGWEPFVAAPNEVTATSANIRASLDANLYAAALQGARPWYYAEYLTTQQLFSLVLNKSPNGLDLFKVVNDPRLSQPSLLTYYFFYALHEEPLRGCEKAGDGATFATFGGEWTSISILINSAYEPLYIGCTSRNVGDPSGIPGENHRTGTTVDAWEKVDRVNDHPKIFVSLGTHGNYLKVGPHDFTPFTPGDVDLNQGTCAEIETLDDVIPGGEGSEYSSGDDVDGGILTLKVLANAIAGTAWGYLESHWVTYGVFPMKPDRKPQDETGGPNFGLVLRPETLLVSEQKLAQRDEEWQTRTPGSSDFIVDRDTQLWWEPRGSSRGYAGRWGPRVTNDPKERRSGMRCPPFALMFLEGLARK